jgi:hypothetical protein
MEDPQLFVEQAGARAAQSRALARNAQVLAWRAAYHHVDVAQRGNLRIRDSGDASKIWRVRQAMGEQGACVRLNLRHANALPAERSPCLVRAFHAGK